MKLLFKYLFLILIGLASVNSTSAQAKKLENKICDSLNLEEKKAVLIVINAKAKYNLKQDKNIPFLENLVLEVNEAVLIIENRKAIIPSLKHSNTILKNNKEVFDFAKKLNLKLYQLTKKTKYLNTLINLHESAINNRIRTRLQSHNNMYFANVPKEVTEKESALRLKLNAHITDKNNPEPTTENVLKSTREWTVFLETIKKKYPKYYNMRYGGLTESLDYLKDRMNDNATVLRYLFVDENLYVFILKKESQKLFKLDYQPVKNHIEKLQKNHYQLEKASHLLFELYQNIWEPFANEITSKSLVIIPDGDLFNLSFDLLTPTKIKSFKELAKKSLLAKHNISYNYSLYLLEQNKNAAKYKNSFIGFAPEFNDSMKKNYKLSVADSINLDKSYLTLLQQPFNVDLAKANAKLFKGDYFINENATENIFKKNANAHKIIHIGTHTQANNINPELSRLIFSKNLKVNNNDGYLYAYEIYNTRLNCNLAILTTTETSKPSYQAGEGMLSLAHAFSYAGSESILTSLWQMDEQSTTEIIEQFYRYIDDGRPKDEALRLAKLTYIKTTKGRTLSPQFWSGLVIIGDTDPLVIATSAPFWQGLIILVSLLLIITVILKFKKN